MQNSKLTNPSAYGTSPNLGEERPQAVLCSGKVGTLSNLVMPSNHCSPKLGELAQSD